MRRWVSISVTIGMILTLVLVVSPGAPSRAQTNDQSTINAQETRIAELEGTVEARGERINAQRTTIAELRGEGESAPVPTKEPADVQSGSGSAYLFGPGLEVMPSGSDVPVEVVSQGIYDGNILPIVVRNNSDAVVGKIELTASVKSAAGDLIGAGGDQGFKPTTMVPGSYAIGYLYFDGTDLPADATFEFDLSYSDPSRGSFSALDLSVNEASFLGDRIVGVLQNDHDVVVSGPIAISVLCLTVEGQIIDHESGYTDQDEADPGQTVPFQISFYGGLDCTYFVIAASGYNF